MTVPLPLPTPAAIQARYAARVKARLERAELTIVDARDGLLDCFLATYYQGVTLGLKAVAAIEGGEDEVARVTAAMFRKRLRLHGTTFEAPTLDALALVKDEVDRELHVVELPAELRRAAEAPVARLLDADLPLAEVERRYTLLVLERNRGSRVATARALGIGTNTLWRKLKLWGVDGDAPR